MSAATLFLKKLLLWPLLINLPLGLLFYLVEGQVFALTFIMGAIVCWLANGIFAFPLLQKIIKRSRQHFLVLFYSLECLKLFLYSLFFIFSLIIWHLAFEPMLIGFVLNLVAYGLISLISLGDH